MNRPRLLILATCCILFAATTACTHTTAKESSQSQNVLAGIALYDEYCAKCHRPLARTSKIQRPVTRLRSSIYRFPAMRNLDFLNEKQLEAISSALATIPL